MGKVFTIVILKLSNNWINLLGPIIGVVVSVFLIEMLLPWLRRNKKKLDEFYNLAYVFVKIRENFRVNIDNVEHNKENCGFFHSFNFKEDRKDKKDDKNDEVLEKPIVFNEIAFFNFVSEKFQYVDPELQTLFISYFQLRGPTAVQKNLNCTDQGLIDLRQKIESKIIEKYDKYRKEWFPLF